MVSSTKRNVSKQLEREKKILEVSRRVFGQFGYKKTVIDDIVNEIGMAKGTFYLHFKTKEELFFAVLKQVYDEVNTELKLIAAKDIPTIEKLKELTISRWKRLENDPIFVFLHHIDPAQRLPFPFQEFNLFKDEVDTIITIIRDVIREGIETGELRPDLDLEYVPGSFASLVYLYAIPERVGYPGDVDKYYETILDMTITGLVNR